MNIFKFRAECMSDVDIFRSDIKDKILKITMEIFPPLPDVVVQIETNISLEKIKIIMSKIRDGHVMLETIARKEEYTGNRKYIFKKE